MVRGRIWITVTLTLSGENPIKQSKETLTSIARHLTNSIPETADKPLPADIPKPHRAPSDETRMGISVSLRNNSVREYGLEAGA